jgi:phosphatidylinositol alpha-1,6-mannosyltransferase
MRILLLSEIFPPRVGGSGRWFWEIYSRLPRRDVVVAAGADPRHTEFDRTHDLNVERLPLSMPEWGVKSLLGLRGYWKALRRLRGVVARWQPGFIHSGRCLPEGVMALALKRWTGLPYLCYVHGEDVRAAASSREQAWLVRQVLGNAALLIANSASTQNILRTEWRVPRRRIRILHPGVDTRRFVPAPPDPLVRAKLGWQDRRVVLTVGRLQKRKGQDRLIEALPAIRQRIPDVLYAIVGGGEEREALQRLAAVHGVENHVQFHGEPCDDEIISCYQQCDLFALPNREVNGDVEGFGMVLLEAQSCGRPVLTGASGGTAETLSMPDTGMVTDCGDATNLAGLVSELLGDPGRLEAMGRRARAWAVERFDWNPLAAATRKCFAEAGPREPVAAAK